MENYTAKINYLYHSGFAVETKDYVLIFDYFNDSVETGKKTILNGAVSEDDLITSKNIIVFSSHSHEDHYNPVILKWRNTKNNIQYILSEDINIMEEECIHKVSPYECIKINNISIETFGSTDIGVSFLVTMDDLTIFHAGDLNWWYWESDSVEEKEAAERQFKVEVNKIKSKVSTLDIAFFPVDPRLNSNYLIGGKFFIEQINPKIFIPMHFGKDYGITKNFKKEIKSQSTNIIEIYSRGQSILFNK